MTGSYYQSKLSPHRNPKAANWGQLKPILVSARKTFRHDTCPQGLLHCSTCRVGCKFRNWASRKLLCSFAVGSKETPWAWDNDKQNWGMRISIGDTNKNGRTCWGLQALSTFLLAMTALHTKMHLRMPQTLWCILTSRWEELVRHWLGL